MTQLLSVRGASQPLTPKSKKFFFMCIIAASRSISNWDAHHGSIGEMFVTYEIGIIVFHVTVLCTATYEKYATKSFEIIKAITDENENPETMCGTQVL